MIVAEIIRGWLRPVATLRARLRRGADERESLALMLAGCFMLFMAHAPLAAARAHAQGVDPAGALAGTFVGAVLMAPLLGYAVAGVLGLLLRPRAGGRAGALSRMVLSWALLSAAPFALATTAAAAVRLPGGLVQGLDLLTAVVFLGLWATGLVLIAREGAGEAGRA